MTKKELEKRLLKEMRANHDGKARVKALEEGLADFSDKLKTALHDLTLTKEDKVMCRISECNWCGIQEKDLPRFERLSTRVHYPPKEESQVSTPIMPICSQCDKDMETMTTQEFMKKHDLA